MAAFSGIFGNLLRCNMNKMSVLVAPLAVPRRFSVSSFATRNHVGNRLVLASSLYRASTSSFLQGNQSLRYQSELKRSTPGVVASAGATGETTKSTFLENPRIRATQTLKKSRWLRLTRTQYFDEDGVEREWESVERVSRPHGALADAVAVLPIFKVEGVPHSIILVSQYRPALGKYCLEFPAGLISKGEDLESAALRELEEETGYVGRAVRTSPPVFNDPGISNTNVSLVTVEIDAEDKLNENPKPVPDEGEFIEVIKLRLHPEEFYDQLDSFLEDGVLFDAKLFSFLNGIQYSEWLLSDDHRPLEELLDPSTPDDIHEINTADNVKIVVSRGGVKKHRLQLEEIADSDEERLRFLQDLTQADVDRIDDLLKQGQRIIDEKRAKEDAQRKSTD